MIHRLLTTADFVAINHPRFSRAMYPKDMKYLSDYHCLEVLNKFSNSINYWDTALSSGKPIFLLANDDVHNVKNMRELARRLTFINSDITKSSFIQALKKGKSYGVDLFHSDNDNIQTKAERIRNLPKPIQISCDNDTLKIILNKKVHVFKFIGQNGTIKTEIYDTNKATYPFTTQDTYIRTEIYCYDGSVIYLNPLYRYAEPQDKSQITTIDIIKTNIKRTFLLLLIISLLIITIKHITKWYKINWHKLFQSDYYKILYLLIAISTIIRAFLAYSLELGNDEVYYITYAKYPDFSHFDHPPMVGWFIQLFSLNLYFDSELFIRLSSIILGAINTYLIFLIGRHIKNELTGLLAAILYNSTIYGFIIHGVFILPDTPQVFFWIMALFYMIKILPIREIKKNHKQLMLWMGILIGLSALSKHSSVFLWIGAGLYILFYNRNWLKIKELYISAFISCLILLPVLYWNYQNEFISFTFQSSRLGISLSNINWNYFFTELFGQIFYTNPIVTAIIIFTLFFAFQKHFSEQKQHFIILLLTGIPIIITFLFFSMFKKTLPHWACPGYISLIILSSVVLSKNVKEKFKLPTSVKIALLFLVITVTAGYLHINHGLFKLPLNTNTPIHKIAKDDPTADLFGWRQAAEKFNKKYKNLFNNRDSTTKIHFVHYEWFPAAHIDYYIAAKYKKQIQVIGDLNHIHKYHWINKKHFELQQGDDAIYITNSRYFKEPSEVLNQYFQTFQAVDTIPIYRDAEIVNYLFIYKCKNFHKQELPYL